MAAKQHLLFVDANIWLDFYRRPKSDAIKQLLNRLEVAKDKIISTHQLEMEFKKNRQNVILEGRKLLVPPTRVSTQGIFSDAKETKAIEKNFKEIARRIEKLRKRCTQLISHPGRYDPVYQTCQRVLSRKSDLVLGLDDKRRHSIRRKAARRFYLGCPPRKNDDTSIGDAYNWEWMVACAIEHECDLVILSHDADYGAEVDSGLYLNDHLRQEFAERVSKQGKAHLCGSIGDALKYFNVKITKKEIQEEEELARSKVVGLTGLSMKADTGHYSVFDDALLQ